MNAHPQPSAPLSDDQLWQRSRAGDREAFGRIVERYQSLVCSLAYSACGSLARSEDLAQETFVTAWQRLGELREPRLLKAWLCGIARRLAANAARREARRGGPVASLASVAEPASADSDPATLAATEEEERLLWRSLAALPETYREPLVLFYREGESVAAVARSLDLTEDAVKQRLSRGRALLRDGLDTVVESTLTRSRPGIGFTIGVLAALPAVTAPPSATAAVVASAAAGHGTGAAKGALASLGAWPLVGPVIGLLVGFLATQAAASTARSEAERASVLRHARRMLVFCWVMSVGLALVLSQVGKLYTASPLGIVVGVLGWTAALVGTVVWTSRRMEREVGRIRAATGTDDSPTGEVPAAEGPRLGTALEYRSAWRLLGLPLVDVACGSIDPASFRSRRAVGWIALGDIALSPLLAFGGFAVAPVAFGGVTLGILSLSLWGVAAGVLAFGSIAVGWWAFGFGALGWEAAAGAAAAARDYAMGGLVQAAEANTAAATAWFAGQWFTTPVTWYLYSAHWIVLAIVTFVVGRLLYRRRHRS